VLTVQAPPLPRGPMPAWADRSCIKLGTFGSWGTASREVQWKEPASRWPETGTGMLLENSDLAEPTPMACLAADSKLGEPVTCRGSMTAASPKVLGVIHMPNHDNGEYQSLLADVGATCQVTYVSNGKAPLQGIAVAHGQVVEDAAQRFLRQSHGDVCVLLAGKLQSDFNDEEDSTENAVAWRCMAVLGDPGAEGYNKDRSIDLVLDTLGGSLDSAFRIALFLSRFTSKLRVYVPRRAKSAGTLIAIGAEELYLTHFAELGPLDTQIPDPRDPTHNVSALDCYQSVDYVRGFGINTLKKVLISLGKEMETGIPLSELMNTAIAVANSSTESMLAHVRALDFGGWGRTLKIGERYAQSLLERAGYDDIKVRKIADKLVYGYTHHPFPIDIKEAKDIGLRARLMNPAISGPALQMVKECADLDIAVGVWEAGKQQTHARGGDGKKQQKSEDQVPGHGRVRDAEDNRLKAGDRAQTPAAVVGVMRDRLAHQGKP
jgi:Serine dehydrogenase proteinase